MNKLFTKIIGVALGLTMAIGVGVAVGNSRDAVAVHATTSTGTIKFGSASGSTAVNSTSVTGDDSLGNTWTITTVTSSSSFTQNASYSQIGSSKQPAKSITATTTLNSSQTISAFSAKFGGFSGTAGSITLKVGDTSVGTGSLSTTSDVIVSASNTTTSGTVLTVTVTGISKGVKFYYVSYSYESGPSKTTTTTTISAAGSKTTLDVTASPADSVVLTPTISYTGGTISSSVTWTSSDTTVATVSSALGTTTTVTAVGRGITTITASYAGDSTYEASNGTITITVANPNEKTYSLKFDDGIVDSTDWGGYAAHGPYSYSETGIGTLNFSFESASKQSGTITEYPVGKNGAVVMVLTSTNYYIQDVTFNGVQWGSKAQTMTINYSTDGGTSYTSTGVSSSTFTATKTGLTVGTNAIKITFSNSSNQIGHKSFEVVYAEKPVLSSVTTIGQKTSFDYGEGFSYGGTLTAHYTAGKADATKTPTAYKFGASDINPDSAGTSITIGTTLTDSTHDGKYIYVGYTEDNVTKWASYQISVGAAPSYYMTLSVKTDTGTNYGYKGGVVEVNVTSSNLAGNIVWTVTAGSVTDATSDNTGYMAAIASVGTLTITATDSGDNTNTQSVSITVVDKLNSVMAAAETPHASNLTFTAASGGSGTADDNATWTVTSDADESVYEAARGIHFGTGSAAVQYVQLSSSNVASGANDTIKSVVVNASDAQSSGNTASLTVTVGGVSFQYSGETSATLGSQATYTFTGSGSGTVVIKADRGEAKVKAIYVKSVVVNYVTAGAESDIANATGMHLAQKAVIDYAKDFNDTLEEICIAYGSTDTSDLQDAWDDLATQYTNWFTNTGKSLTSKEKAHAKALFANASSVDRNVTASADELQHMLAKYDWIVGHYSNCGDFLNTDAGTGRDAVPQASSRVILNTIIGNSNTVAIIVVISMISVTCIGGYFFLRKRKEQ